MGTKDPGGKQSPRVEVHMEPRIKPKAPENILAVTSVHLTLPVLSASLHARMDYTNYTQNTVSAEVRQEPTAGTARGVWPSS